MATKKPISPEAWQEFLSNEYVELSSILSPYAELILKAEGWKATESPTQNKRFSKKGSLVELTKTKEGNSIAYKSEFEDHKQRKPTVIDLLRDNKQDPSDLYEHTNKARKYAFKYDAASYKSFLKKYPEIGEKIAYHNQIDTPAVRMEQTLVPKSYKEEESLFLIRASSIFQVADALGFKPHEARPGENYIPKEVVNQLMPHVHLKDIVETFQGRMRYEDNSFKIASPFDKEGQGVMTVNPGGTSFYCETTKKGGNAITYLMEKEKMEYVEAVKYLAAQVHFDIDAALSKVKVSDKVLFVKGEDKLALKVQDSGIHTYYNISKGEGGNIVKLIEQTKGVDKEGAVSLLKDLFVKKVESGNVPDEVLINFTKKAFAHPSFKDELKNTSSLINALSSNEVVAETLVALSGKPESKPKASLTMEATAKKFGVNIEASSPLAMAAQEMKSNNLQV